jgi:predicted transcriptional regulator
MTQLALVWDRVNPQDQERAEKLTGDLRRVYECLSDGKAWTVQAIAQSLRIPETSASAQCRNLRKNGLTVKRVSITKGLSAYQMEVK